MLDSKMNIIVSKTTIFYLDNRPFLLQTGSVVVSKLYWGKCGLRAEETREGCL